MLRDLKNKSLVELAALAPTPKEMDRFELGRIFNESLTRFENFKKFAAWARKNFNVLGGTTIFNIMDLERVFKNKEKLGGRGYAMAYIIAGKTNDSIRAELLTLTEDGKMTVAGMKREIIKLKRKNPVQQEKPCVPVRTQEVCETLPENLEKLEKTLMMLVPPHHLKNLTSHAQSWIVSECDELLNLTNALNNQQSKKVLIHYIKLLGYHQHVFKDSILENLPEEIKLLRIEIDKKNIDLTTREAQLKKSSMALRERLSKKEILLINSCLHPDRVGAELVDKYNAAFAAFNKAL